MPFGPALATRPDVTGIGDTHMSVETCADDQPRESQSVADLLDTLASRSQGWGCNIRATIVVDNNSNNNIRDSNDGLAKEQRLLIVTRFAHLGRDREEDGCTGVGEDKGRDGRDGICKGRRVDQLIVGLPLALLGRRVRAVLDADGDGHNKDWRRC